FQMTPSINCPTDPIGLVEYKLSRLCVSSALGKSSAARKQRTNRTTNVAVRPQPNGTIWTGPVHAVSVITFALAIVVLLGPGASLAARRRISVLRRTF